MNEETLHWINFPHKAYKWNAKLLGVSCVASNIIHHNYIEIH